MRSWKESGSHRATAGLIKAKTTTSTQATIKPTTIKRTILSPLPDLRFSW
jgi:hypothetical protein